MPTGLDAIDLPRPTPQPASTGLEEILENAKIPKGSFYYYFESKTRFGLAVIDNYSEIWARKLERLLKDQSVPPLRRIENYIDEGIHGLKKYSFKRGCLVGNMGQEMAALDNEFRFRILAVLSSWAERLSECLEEARQSGEIDKDMDVDIVAKFFWSAWEGTILQAKLENSTEPLERFRTVMFRYVFLAKP
ncbi:TetR family transcriptional regulator C-terminal domain-containing protein [Pseudohoeflea coraliihabitans]|uniref:TetR family transcriptional regulator C-terminal domain-containing protein n=1 Tax=Pseudohoeflea coraliihabitans TaxID=2860393 RepID=A0ABS6WK36_9HYPH|nr:TetR family transcriptional regulator C-terminal domain-containing protein [Pseudohoeflea sp. DP4N28-3]MBW3096235.1 TetR family transcriptional regulator C-terminal domain-containing protein [Pseudohoeflea sp. DP4N28-3]